MGPDSTESSGMPDHHFKQAQWDRKSGVKMGFIQS